MMLSSLSPDHDSRLEDWFTGQYRRLVLDGKAGRASGGCPDEEFLKAISGKAGKPSLLDPRVSHVGHCADCLAKVLAFREAGTAEPIARGRRWPRVVLAVCAGCFLLVIFFALRLPRHTDISPVAVVEKTLDLSPFGTLRGVPQHLEAVRLPAALVRVRIILPQLSEIGTYRIAVSADEFGQQPLARASAAAIQNGEQQMIEVMLDLRGAKPGSYYLSTTFETDRASNRYPVLVEP